MAVAVSSSCSLLRLAAFWPVDSSQWKRHPFVFFSNLPSDLVRTSLRVSRRSPSYPNEAVVAVPDPRVWRGNQDDEKDDHGENDSDDDEGEDRSLDLLVQFLHNMFRKISRRTRKAVRSVLPPSISTNLVRFSVDGVLILALLWITKAFLEVACTLGTLVFVSILLVRAVWSGVCYMKESQYYGYMNRIYSDDDAWSGARPAT
ncbi:protein SHORT HYPOCOTYL IN WHITE LIGHT 1 isoform X1 [Dioscorea cayenensis subsp. rotundata]|uniref:Protein SHORT HYPOCOTYL IN WHITE LIGHT 1 isoform X1 n=1 Tax=Dioscorea cayennensis subsp. rotundata TaxID=55577 RepID=A0AB40CAR4_DIOCR|nr:protein SHORT HYPOCOTYL IN WHITE LIGHT 1 isoform X1 [Dioscorea cayenensis subsp. rotundata]